MTARRGAMSEVEDDWGGKFQLHKQNIFQALATEDISYIHIRSAMAVQSPQPNPTRALYATGAPDAVDAKIKDINTQAIKKQQDTYEEFSREVDGLKTSKPNEAEWKAKLEQKRIEMKEKSLKAIDESFDTAEKYIRKLPQSQRNAAFNVFSVGADQVTKAAEFVYGKIKEVISSVVDFLNGIWDKVVTTYNAVKDYFSGILGSVFSMPGLAAPISADSGLFEGSVTWQHAVTLGEAATRLDTSCNLLDFVIERAEGPKPVYTVVSKFINHSEEKCVANVLFNVTEHAPQLGQHFKGLLENQAKDITTSWTMRGEQSVSPPVSNEPSGTVTDYTYGLNLDQSLTESAAQTTLNSLQSAISAALNGKYIIQTGEIVKTRKSWETDIICRKVSLSEGPGVSDTIQKVFTEELGRNPKLFTFEKL